MKANVNSQVMVTLTEYGISVFNKSEYSRHEKLNENRLWTQLWTLMKIFGNEMYVGSKQVFENNIIEIEE